MKVANPLVWTVSLALVLALPAGCGGKVIVDGEGSDGRGGDGGAGGDGSSTVTVSLEPPGNAGNCAVVECTKDADSCSCKTACMGPDLRADCALKDDGNTVCECHYDGAYMGLCAHFGGALCGLPGGCCLDYLAE